MCGAGHEYKGEVNQCVGQGMGAIADYGAVYAVYADYGAVHAVCGAGHGSNCRLWWINEAEVLLEPERQCPCPLWCCRSGSISTTVQ